MSISKRLGWTLGFLLLFILSLGAWTFLTLRSIRNSVQVTLTRAVKAGQKTGALRLLAHESSQALLSSGKSATLERLPEAAKLKETFLSSLPDLRGLSVHRDEVDALEKAFKEAAEAGESYVRASASQDWAQAGQLSVQFAEKRRGLNYGLDLLDKAEADTAAAELASVSRRIDRALGVFAGGLAFCLALGLVLFVSLRRSLKPLALAVGQLEDLSRGAADLNFRLPADSQDEVGRLGHALNRFLESLSRLVREIRKSSEQVATSASALQHITRQSSSNISQAVQVMSQISQNTTQVAQSVQATASASLQVGKSAESGGEVAVSVVARMKEAQASVTDTAGFIHQLGKRSDQIGKILDVITKIADQTNLLSLNAAIEAARAGESGRGFAVVADEVRKLAETSAESTKQITGLIREVQEETRSAIERSVRGSQKVTESYRMVLEAEKLFSTIAREVSQMTQQMTQVAANTEQVAASTEEATASSEEQSAAMEQVAANSEELSRVVENLRSLVGEFTT